MKKIVVFLTLLLIVAASFAQTPQVVMVITDTTAYLNRQLKSGQLTYTTQDKVMRVLSVDIGPPKKFSWIMYSTTRYTLPAATSNTMSTTGNATVGGNLAVTGAASTASLTVTGYATVTGYLNPVGPFYADSSLYFGDDQDNVWMRFAYQQMGTPASRLVLENLADISVQNKAGTGQVVAIQRDTTGSTVKINLPNVLYSVQDCTHVTTASVLDSLGFRLKSANGKIWKIRVSPTGLITAIESAAP